MPDENTSDQGNGEIRAATGAVDKCPHGFPGTGGDCCRNHTYEGLCPDALNGPDSRQPGCPACEAEPVLVRVGVVACAHGLPYAQWDDVSVPWGAVLYVLREDDQ